MPTLMQNVAPARVTAQLYVSMHSNQQSVGVICEIYLYSGLRFRALRIDLVPVVSCNLEALGDLHSFSKVTRFVCSEKLKALVWSRVNTPQIHRCIRMASGNMRRAAIAVPF